eukprot:TRINITY_DN2592_c1_g1_i3.p1 TRINITY_DN2592_c1_g1~~TRINITY_DN2592_c1_g1_i3.p1  ORF type:complete len:160 (-),score=64.24 TRINITY_DN2592_c1_g1_i3:221-700(-)
MATEITLQDRIHQLKENVNVIRAAHLIANASVLIVQTGAGMSADSGLPIYKDVADVEAYRKSKLSYYDLCQPDLILEDPSLFYGFWFSCFNDYRTKKPHNGYNIITKWKTERFGNTNDNSERIRKQIMDACYLLEEEKQKKLPGAFFVATSNVNFYDYY